MAIKVQNLSKSLDDLNALCREIRKTLIEILAEAKSGHTAGPLGAVEQYVALYFGGVLKYNPQEPN